MFTRFLAMVSIGAVTIRPVFAMFTVVLFVAMFRLAILFSIWTMGSIWTMITVWLVMTIRLVSLMQW